MISKEVKIIEQRWQAKKIEIGSLQAAAGQACEPHKCLISMCERLMISAPSSQIIRFKSITQDLDKLTEKNQEFQTI